MATLNHDGPHEILMHEILPIYPPPKLGKSARASFRDKTEAHVDRAIANERYELDMCQ